jgi:hypothetical protein
MQKLYQEVRACSRTGKVPMKVACFLGFITRDCANFERQVKSQGQENQELKRKVREMNTNWEMLKESKKAKKGIVSPARLQILKEAASTIRDTVCRKIKEGLGEIQCGAWQCVCYDDALYQFSSRHD